MAKLLELPVQLLILLTLAAYCAVVFSSTDTIVSFGANCNENQVCDSTKSLECVNDVCQCAIPEAMVVRNDSCSVTLNGTCFIQDSSATPTNSNNATPTSDGSLPCVENAVCDRLLKICVCEENFVEQSGNICVAKRQIGESCNSSSECREDLGLTCDNEVCICHPNTTIYSRLESTCVGLAEKPCVSNACTAFARCITMEEDDSESGSGRICDCIEGYDPTPSGTCAKDYGISCNATGQSSHCKPWLTCGASGTCECPNSTYQFYDEQANACLSKVKGPCVANFSKDGDNSNGMNCGIGAECVINQEDHVIGSRPGESLRNSPVPVEPTFHCMCKKGYEATDCGKCQLAYGSVCITPEETSNVHTLCKWDANLECIDGKCDCNSEYTYDKQKKSCLGRVGALCHIERALEPLENKTNATTSAKTNQKLIGCVSGATCEADESAIKQLSYEEPRDSLLSYGKCQCRGKELDDDTCEVVVPPSACPIIILGSVVLFLAMLGTFGFLLYRRLVVIANTLQ